MGKLGSDAEEEGADEEGDIDASLARGVDGPVEDKGEDEEGDGVEGLIVAEVDVGKPEVRAERAEH